MEGFILNENFEILSVLDFYESFIWTERYNLFGDFEIFAPATHQILSKVLEGRYIRIKGSGYHMIIEDIALETDMETGNKITISGRSLESIIDRRIIWQQTVLSGNLQNSIQRLLNEAIISPSLAARRIPNFIFQASVDPKITTLIMDAQFTGTNLYEAMHDICDVFGLGFRIMVNLDKQFVFQLYSGVDHSFAQNERPYIIFASEFDNIINSRYFESERAKKTVTLVAGEGEGLERRTLSVYADNSLTGLNRREMYTDARDIQSNNGEILPDDYNKLLTQRGLEKLEENSFVETFDGQIKEGILYKYGQDFFMGDILQVVNEYGMESRSRVIELIRKSDVSGTDIYPTFGTVA